MALLALLCHPDSCSSSQQPTLRPRLGTARKDSRPNARPLFAVLLAVFVPTSCVCGLIGCSRPQDAVPTAPSRMPTEEVVRQSLLAISNPDTPPEGLDRALDQLQAVPEVKEEASLWVKIIDDPAYGIDHRGRCLGQYFRRHVKVPISVTEFGKLPGMRKWLRKETLSYAVRDTSGFSVALAKQNGSDLLRFTPEFAQARPVNQPWLLRAIGMCLLLSRDILIGEFLDIIQGKKAKQPIQLIEFHEPRIAKIGCSQKD